MENTIKTLINFLPKCEDLQEILVNNAEAKYILESTLRALTGFGESSINKSEDKLEESSFLVQALVDKCWELIHTGHFSSVPVEIRKTYAIGCFCKIIFMLIECSDTHQLELCSKVFDEAILIGCTQNLFPNVAQFMEDVTELIDKNLTDAYQQIDLPILEIQSRCDVKCDILQLNKPSLQDFNDQCFKPHHPALLLNTFEHWPALQLWHDLKYLLKVAGNRTVPIEIGSNYSTDDWSQQLMKIKDFLQRQFGNQQKNVTAEDIEYLAQHELFEQIPQLKKDFSIPDYCSLGENKESVDIKAWLGPKGTISPMHYDPKHNLLCQVFGTKHIILASPEDSIYLYQHESEFLTNTSQIDADNVDYEKFPEASKAKFYTLTLQRGDCVYIPPKWWHHVRSASPSFSVSFWWE